MDLANTYYLILTDHFRLSDVRLPCYCRCDAGGSTESRKQIII